MSQLRNIYDTATLTKRLQTETFQRITLSFYKYVKIENPAEFRDELYKTFDVTKTGRHLSAAEFNSALENPDTIVVDMRNNYESEVGHFKGAVLPAADTFKEELPMVVDMLKGKQDKKILLYCTGGIRCE